MKSICFLIFFISLTLTACSSSTDNISISPDAKLAEANFLQENKERIARSLILIGDTGTPNERVYQALRQSAKLVADRTSILFLGDNVYNKGIRDPSHRLHAQSVSRLQYQLQSIVETGIPAVFTPGNHDWDKNGSDGWNAILRQESIIEKELGPGSFLPSGGCPGPSIAFSDKETQVVVFGSDWFEHPYEKPTSKDLCANTSISESMEGLTSLLSQADPNAIRIFGMHLPLKSFGSHGRGDSCPGDLNCPERRMFVNTLLDTLDPLKPLVCVGGHDHNLQIIRGEYGCQYFLVSGAGSRVKDVESGPGKIFTAQSLGFMRLDRMKDGRTRLAVITPRSTYAIEEGRPAAKEIFAIWLD